MKPGHLARYFKLEELSDAWLVVKVSRGVKLNYSDAQGDAEDTTASVKSKSNVVAKFPAHRLVLFSTDYFSAQAGHEWVSVETRDDASSSSFGSGTCSDAGVDDGSGGTDHDAGGEAAAVAPASSLPELHLPIDSSEQLPASEAVIAALYGVPDAISSLKQQQLVDVVVIADRIGAPAVAEQAVQALKAAAEQAEQGLAAATIEALASLPAWPACLLPLLLPVLARSSCCTGSAADLNAVITADTRSRVQRMLLGVFGDLDAAWEDRLLQEVLLQLPLPAMQLLLSSDQLRVALEDTVLYTANKFVSEQQSFRAAAARTALAPLVRATHLSRFALSGQVFGTSSNLLLSSCSTQLKQLASYRLITVGNSTPATMLKALEDAPASWSLGKRPLRATDGVRLVWRLPVEQLAQACRDSFAGSSMKDLYSPDSTPPVGAMAWKLNLVCNQKEEDGVKGTKIGLFVTAHKAPAGILRVFTCTLTGHGISHKLVCSGVSVGYGYPDFFDLGCISEGGGWDEAAWAAKGLPTSGELELSLHMHSVGA